MKRFIVAVMIITSTGASASPALAGTRYLSNLVPTTPGQSGLSPSSRVQLKENGRFTVVLAGITDEDGVPVTTDLSFRLGQVLTGDEYVVVLSGSLPAFGEMPFQVNLPVELTGGNGAAARSVSSVVQGIMGRDPFVTVERVELYGPVGAQWLAACQASIDGGGVIYSGELNPCSRADEIGRSGVRLITD